MRERLPSFHLDTDFMADLRAAIIENQPRFPNNGSNCWIDLEKIDSAKVVACDIDDPEFEIRISSRTITPVLRLTHPITRNTERPVLKQAKIPVSKPWRTQKQWRQILEKEKVAKRHENEHISDGEIKDQKSLSAFKKASLNDHFEFYIRSESFEKLRPSTKKQAEYSLRSRFLNYYCGKYTFGRMPGSSISQEEARQWQDDIFRGKGKFQHFDHNGKPKGKKSFKPSRAMAIQSHRYVRRFFAILVQQGRLDRNPFANIPLLEACPERTRFQKPQQIRELWMASEALPPNQKDYFRFLLLSAQRRTQAARLRWDWIDWKKNCITFPGQEVKGRNRKTAAFVMPMSKPVRELLMSRKNTTNGLLVFGGENDTPISNFSRLAARIDAALNGGNFNWSTQKRDAPFGWSMHDFRRTASSLLQKTDPTFRPFHTKLLIAHKLVTGDPVKSYWRSEDEMIVEKRRLFELLGQEIMACVT